MTALQNSPSVTIGVIAIRQDADGRYSLNDLWKSAGGEKRHAPNEWLRNQQTADLVNELTEPGIPGSEQKQPVITLKGGNVAKQGTYVVRELVYAYAMWISPSFHLKVIHTFDAVMTGGGDGGERPPIDTILPSEAQTLKEIAHRKLADLPPEIHGKALAEIWSRVQRKFRINTYTYLSRTQLTDAITYIMQMDLHCAPAAPKPRAPELFTAGDMKNLERLVWINAHYKHQEQSWRNAVWYALRQATDTPSPQRFKVEDIPVLAAEVARCLTITTALHDAMREAERIAIKRLVRSREAAEPILAELRANLLAVASEEAHDINRVLTAWEQYEIANFVQRRMLGQDATEAEAMLERESHTLN